MDVFAGVRSMLYGSMLGLLGAAVLGTLAARYMGLSSFQDLKPTPDPQGSALQRWLQPCKERIQARVLLRCSQELMYFCKDCLHCIL